MKIIKQKIRIWIGLFCVILSGFCLNVEASEYGEDANVYKKQLDQLYEDGRTEEEKLENVQDFLMDRIAYMGYRPIKQSVSDTDVETGKNIVFRRKGLSEKSIVLEACYNENALGTGILLEMANQLGQQKELPYSVLFLLTEKGSGSSEYLSQLEQEEKNNIEAAVSFYTVKEQDGIQMRTTETKKFQWLGKQILSVADEIGISISDIVQLPSVWEQSQIPQVAITISNSYTQLRNAAMLMDVWIGNVSPNRNEIVISEQYRMQHGIAVQANTLTFRGIAVQKIIGMIVILACSTCLLVFFFQVELRRKRRKRREKY